MDANELQKIINGATLDESAIATHEMFDSYVRAGFTREEAMQIVLNNMRIATKIVFERFVGNNNES